jgi:hypothetical protein
MLFECENVKGDMRCGNTSFRVEKDTKLLVCIACRNKVALMSFFADTKTDSAPLPDFANKQSKEGKDEAPESIEVTDPVKTQREKWKEKMGI